MDDDYQFSKAFFVKCIVLSNSNIDGIGGAIIEMADVEVVEYKSKYDSIYREYRTSDIQYAIINYIKLEELILSAEWIVSDYGLDSKTFPIEQQIKMIGKSTKIG